MVVKKAQWWLDPTTTADQCGQNLASDLVMRLGTRLLTADDFGGVELVLQELAELPDVHPGLVQRRQVRCALGRD